jgi:hypothetical protein
MACLHHNLYVANKALKLTASVSGLLGGMPVRWKVERKTTRKAAKAQIDFTDRENLITAALNVFFTKRVSPAFI